MESRTLLSASYPLDRSVWTALGPGPILGSFDPAMPVTGRAVGVAADPSDVDRIFLASAGGGVWQTSDGGSGWNPLTDDQPTLVMGSLAMAPGDPNVLYAGTGEANGAEDSYPGRGILVSLNGGEHWTLTGQGLFDRRTVGEIAIDPQDPKTAYAAVSSLAEGTLNGKTGIYKTTDAGATWVSTTDTISQNGQFTSIQIDPTDSQVLYAAVGDPLGSSANGVYKSIDGGETWKASGNFPRGGGIGRVQLAIAPSRPETLYAAITDPRTFNSQGIYKTTDAGATWTKTTAPPEYMAGQGFYNSFLKVSPSDPDVVFAGGSGLDRRAGIIASLDGGQSWSSIQNGENGASPRTNFHSGDFDAQGRLLVVSDGGIWRLDSFQTGEVRWTNLNGNLQISQLNGVAIHPNDPNIVYGGTPYNGMVRFNDAIGWTQVRGGDGGLVRFDPSGNLIYHAYHGSSLEFSSNGNFWGDLSSGIQGEGNRYSAYQVDSNGRVLYGTDRINALDSYDGRWSQLSRPGQGGWPAGARVDAIEVARNDPGVIYASANGALYITTDNGASWRYSNVPGHAVAAIAIDPLDSRVAYIVRNQFGGNRVLKTTDGGQSWSDISGDLPDLPIHTIQVGKTTSGDVLYLGNDDGVYSSQDGRLHWSRLGTGLPRAKVVELDLNPRLGILAAATYGRGLFELSLKNEPIRLVDNNGFGFRVTGSGWTLEPFGLSGNARAHARGNGSEYAQWTFGQSPGTFELFATWVPDSSNSHRAFYEVYDGDALIGKIEVNQKLVPNGTLTNGAVFQSLGVFTSQANTIFVRLPVSNQGRVIADAVFLAAPYGLDLGPATPLLSKSLTSLSSGRAWVQAAAITSETTVEAESEPGRSPSPSAIEVDDQAPTAPTPAIGGATPVAIPTAIGRLGSGRNQGSTPMAIESNGGVVPFQTVREAPQPWITGVAPVGHPPVILPWVADPAIDSLDSETNRKKRLASLLD